MRGAILIPHDCMELLIVIVVEMKLWMERELAELQASDVGIRSTKLALVRTMMTTLQFMVYKINILEKEYYLIYEPRDMIHKT